MTDVNKCVPPFRGSEPSPHPGPLISVVVVNWNRRALLETCLRSLERQVEVALEIIVVDNGSTDGSVELVNRIGESGGSCPVHLIQNRENRGFCTANNQGFRVARGEFVALLNNDAEAEPDWLRELVRAFAGRPDVGMAASKILVWEDPRRIDKAGHLIYLDGQNRGRGTGQQDAGQFDRVEEVLWPDGCAAMYRRRMLEEIGGFDEDFFAYADDAELGLRARIAGWKCLYMPQAVVRHHRGATLGAHSFERIELIERNRVLLAAKLFPGRLLWLNAVYYLARVGAGIWAAIRNRGEVRRYPTWGAKMKLAATLVKADWKALTMLPRMLAKRRKLKRIRKLTASEVVALLRRHRIPLRELMEEAI